MDVAKLFVAVLSLNTRRSVDSQNDEIFTVWGCRRKGSPDNTLKQVMNLACRVALKVCMSSLQEQPSTTNMIDQASFGGLARGGISYKGPGLQNQAWEVDLGRGAYHIYIYIY